MYLGLQTAIFLFFAGALGGALNAVAGGGSFIAFPALLFSGVAPIAANATNTVALWVGVTASSGAYRKHLDISRRVMIPLAVTSVIGAIAGAYLLLHTPAQTFLRALPWLMLGATLLFLFGNRLARGSGGSIARTMLPLRPWLSRHCLSWSLRSTEDISAAGLAS